MAKKKKKATDTYFVDVGAKYFLRATARGVFLKRFEDRRWKGTGYRDIIEYKSDSFFPIVNLKKIDKSLIKVLKSLYGN